MRRAEKQFQRGEASDQGEESRILIGLEVTANLHHLLMGVIQLEAAGEEPSSFTLRAELES
jgi:hypothetical protein